jgi:hypothetical protein
MTPAPAGQGSPSSHGLSRSREMKFPYLVQHLDLLLLIAPGVHGDIACRAVRGGRGRDRGIHGAAWDAGSEGLVELSPGCRGGEVIDHAGADEPRNCYGADRGGAAESRDRKSADESRLGSGAARVPTTAPVVPVPLPVIGVEPAGYELGDTGSGLAELTGSHSTEVTVVSVHGATSDAA